MRLNKGDLGAKGTHVDTNLLPRSNNQRLDINDIERLALLKANFIYMLA